MFEAHVKFQDVPTSSFGDKSFGIFTIVVFTHCSLQFPLPYCFDCIFTTKRSFDLPEEATKSTVHLLTTSYSAPPDLHEYLPFILSHDNNSIQIHPDFTQLQSRSHSSRSTSRIFFILAPKLQAFHCSFDIRIQYICSSTRSIAIEVHLNFPILLTSFFSHHSLSTKLSFPRQLTFSLYSLNSILG